MSSGEWAGEASVPWRARRRRGRHARARPSSSSTPMWASVLFGLIVLVALILLLLTYV
ncbi:hypothetical protein [Saccharothrix sp. ALI-22-I]|uniref:hypothetical protein n=1 Tax=Saccharothrix sp. ALI-22-I TaxID=1933778 RepID=UPI0015C36579|nr:hypothetical protein [Saccharothrix sp. ALI-22-I]